MAGLVDEVYTIQDILAHDYRPIPGRRTSNKGILYFLIRWQGWLITLFSLLIWL